MSFQFVAHPGRVVPRVPRRLEAVDVIRICTQRRFVLFAQPIVSLGGSDYAGERHELLLRVLDAEGNATSPDALLRTASRQSLMPLVDRHVVQAAFEWIAAFRLREPSRRLLSTSINVSWSSTEQAGFAAHVCALARRMSIVPAQICIEVTEEASIDDLAAVLRTIAELKGAGFRIALDDFGKGSSSFAYMKALPFDYIKIDGGFVQNALEDSFDRAVVEAASRIARQCGMKTVAEYVDGPELARYLGDVGIDFIQGYWVGAPAATP